MNDQIEQRITPSLNALRSSLTDEELRHGHALARQWLAPAAQPAPGHLHLAAALLRGNPVTRAFSPVTNSRKLTSGHAAHAGLVLAARALTQALRAPGGLADTLGASISAFLEKAAVLVAVAALEADFQAALKAGQKSRARTLLAQAMHVCPQGPRQTTMEHCRSVAQHFRVLHARLKHPELAARRYPNWNQHLPKWFATWRAELVAALEGHAGLAHVYLEWHDCGKPFCLEFDAQGRAHFPDHAERSAHLWEQVGGRADAARLMAQDMDLQTLPPSAMTEFAKREHAALLLVAALAAVNANAQMFGGVESDSFKIKAKQLEARGKRLCEALFGVTNIKAVA
jgi:hypothetical protein